MQGLIINNIANSYLVETKEQIIKCSAKGKLKKEEITPVVGDKVEVELVDSSKQEGVIQQIQERRNYTKRPKLANLTQIILVVSANMPKPDLLMLDKQLAFAHLQDITPIIVLNKIDLKSVKEIRQIYEKIGYKIIETNAKTGEGVEQLKAVLKNNMSAFSGNSGVGKSTLLNQIFQKEITKQGEISNKNQKGKNTTTATKLYKIDEKSYIADTPGFATFEIYEIPKEELYQHFIEFVEHEQGCAYVGCTHVKEQECGIKQAVEQEKISKQRYQNYSKIYLELKDKEEHKW